MHLRRLVAILCFAFCAATTFTAYAQIPDAPAPATNANQALTPEQAQQALSVLQDPAKRAAGDISGATHCELLALEPPRHMVFSWYYPDMPKTEVLITLEPSDGGTRVALVHTGWDQFDGEQIKAIRDMLAGGWGSFVLPQLKRLAEG